MMTVQFMPAWRKGRMIRKIGADTIAASNKMLNLIEAEKNPYLRLCLITAAAIKIQESIGRMKAVQAFPLLRIKLKNRHLEYWKGSGFKLHKFKTIIINGLKPTDMFSAEKIIELLGSIDAKSDH